VENMKKSFKQILLVALCAALCILICTGFLTACPEPRLVSEPYFLYELEVNVINESSSEYDISTEVFSLHNDVARKIYDLEIVRHAACSNETYTFSICEGECAEPHLSHILKINENIYAGFNAETVAVVKDNPEVPETIIAVKDKLGSVDWTVQKNAVINFNDETFEIAEKGKIAKFIYTVTVKDEENILPEEAGDYTNGIKFHSEYTLCNY
jgi:hypothetical protein